MVELIRTDNLVTISAVEALLASAGIHVFAADAHVSALEGSIGAFQRRLLVPVDDAQRARRLLLQAGFGDELR